MHVSSSTVKGVFGNLHFICPRCGKPNRTGEIQAFGRKYTVPYYGTCGCEESLWDMIQCTDAERELARAGIPERYLSVKHDADGWWQKVSQGTSLYIHGPNGTAKSTVAASIAKSLIDFGATVRWENSKHLISEIQGMYEGRRTDALERCYACRVLVLDDLGKEQPTAYAISTLYELVEMRYGDRKPIIATSNFDRAQLASRWAAADPETAAAIVSRLCDGCETLEMYGRDLRV